MNALYAGSKGEVYDPLEGAADSSLAVSASWAMRARESGRLFPRPPRFHFSAQYAQAVDREGVAASIRERLGLQRLSRERIR